MLVNPPLGQLTSRSVLCNFIAFITFIFLPSVNLGLLTADKGSGFGYFEIDQVFTCCFGAVTVFMLLFYFWDFPFHPLVNITIKSGMISVLYLGLIYMLNLSPEINEEIDKYLKKGMS